MLPGPPKNLHPPKHIGSRIYLCWRWILWGLRWLAIIVFGLLFCIGVFFALPWKILACLLVIPLVGIFVPYRYQPWCWGVLTAAMIGVAAWLYVPRQDSGRWRTYRFDGDLAHVVQNRRIDGLPNAASLYDRVLVRYDETIFDLGQRDLDMEWQTFNNPWSPEDYPELKLILEPFEPAIPVLIEAAALEQCRFPIAYDLMSLRLQQRRINQLKGWGRLLIRSANADIRQGRYEEALQKELAVLGMARHLYQQQSLFDQAGGFFLELVAARSLKRHALDFAEKPDDLDRIQNALHTVDPDWPGAWEGVLAQEKLIAKNIAALLYQVDDNGRTRISRNAIASVGEGMGYSIPAILQYQTISRATVLALWLSIPISPQSSGRLIDRRFDKYSELARRGTPAPVFPIQYIWRLGLNPASAVDWLARHQTSFYAALDGQYKNHMALMRVTSIMVQLKRYWLEHTSWPESLSQIQMPVGVEVIIDPVSGTEFVYGKTGNGFYLYSKGPNGIDDKGQNDSIKGFDDIVFWPLNPSPSGF